MSHNSPAEFWHNEIHRELVPEAGTPPREHLSLAMWQRIASVHNSKLKAVRKLRDASVRKATKATVAEGVTELSRAADGGYVARQMFVCPDLCDREIAAELARRLKVPESQIFEVSSQVYRTIAFGEREDGILGVIQTKDGILEQVHVPKSALVIVLEGIEKPGNLGAILRSADAAGVDTVIIVDARCDPWGPNVIRASLGTIFTVPFCSATASQAVAWLTMNRFSVVAADPHARETIWEIDFSPPVAIVLGAEHAGLSPVWSQVTHRSARIPMFGRADSLNVSVAAALFIYEACRRFVEQGVRTLPCHGGTQGPCGVE